MEQVSEILRRACPGGVVVEASFQLLDEGLAARVDPARPAVVRGYVSALDAAAARGAVEGVRRNLGHLQAFDLRPIGALTTKVVLEEEWAEAWKGQFPLLRIGRRVVVRPTWRRHRPRPGEVVIDLDPGMAFGTGLHPTTRLCLEGLEAWADAGLVDKASVLDVGCGSGILGVAAGLFGAGRVLGLDTDPLAVEATRQNAARNGLREVVEARRGSLPLADDGPFGLVLANLIASLLVDLAAEMSATVEPRHGRLLASGIFVDREQEVVSAFESAGLRVIGRRTETDWVALEADRAA